MINVFYTDHKVNQTVTQFLSKSQKYPLDHISKYNFSKKSLFASYGILRGVDEIIKKQNNYIYMDHGYLNASTRKFNADKSTLVKLDGHIRLLRDDLYFNQNYLNYDKNRFNKLNIDLHDLNKKGNYILLSVPSENTSKYLNLKNWTENTIKEIEKFTDREVITHNKFSKTPLTDLLDNAFAFVSCQSTAGFISITKGIPAYFTHSSLKKFGDVKNINNRTLNHELLYAAANSQWKLKEFFSDEFKSYIDKITI
tara:strand:+ start:809 stop:1570 length:762 start_codon:yes stop_codon:yes gene_type:complete